MTTDERSEPRGEGTAQVHAGQIARMKRENDAKIAQELDEQEAYLKKSAQKSAAQRRAVAGWGLLAVGLWNLAMIAPASLSESGVLIPAEDPKYWIVCVVLGGAIASFEQILTALGRR